MQIDEVIHGKVPSKPNSYKIGIINGHATLIKQNSLRKYEQQFYIQCRNRGAMIQSMFIAEIDVYFTTMASDLDNSFKIILDCLQKADVIKNDNKCVEIKARKHIDKIDPRVEIKLKTIEI